jgi:anti-sigma-K factor RskA
VSAAALASAFADGAQTGLAALAPSLLMAAPFTALPSAPVAPNCWATIDATTVFSNLLVSATASTVVTVTNALPTISPLGAITRTESSGVFSVTFTVDDLETPASALTITVDSTNPVLLQPVSLGITGNGAQRTLTVSPANNVSGAATIAVTVHDANGGSASRSFLLTVLARRIYVPIAINTSQP